MINRSHAVAVMIRGALPLNGIAVHRDSLNEANSLVTWLETPTAVVPTVLFAVVADGTTVRIHAAVGGTYVIDAADLADARARVRALLEGGFGFVPFVAL